MIDPMLTLSFAIHTNPGVYAFLLGSGISRAAGIPTGWEVVEDLIRKLARLRGEPEPAEPHKWFVDTFKEPPTYSTLLKDLAATPAERQQILKGYFEPTSNAAGPGQRRPTQAHNSLAALIKSKSVRIVLTTNFDKLMEQALEAVGVHPTVISSADAADGAVPLPHTSCTLVKLHGDYLDVRTMNTPDELAKYDPRIDLLLDRILDDFGLVVCGWSAEWDMALRAAFERCKARRYTTYWAMHGKPTVAATDLITLRAAQVIPIGGADAFVSDLETKVTSLAAVDPSHPMSVKIAVVTLKRYLAEEKYGIPLYDLIADETKRVLEQTSDALMVCSGAVPFRGPEITARLARYDAIAAILMNLLATGCFHGSPSHHELWVRALERVASRPEIGGDMGWTGLRSYPAALLLYSGCVAALGRKRFDTARVLLLGPKVRRSQNPEAIYEVCVPPYFVHTSFSRAVHGKDMYTPMSDRLFEVVRESVRDTIPDDDDYEDTFHLFEYLVALIVADGSIQAGDAEPWVPLGRFAWQGRLRRWGEVRDQLIKDALLPASPFRTTFFASQQRFEAAVEAVKKHVGKARFF